MVAVTLGVLQPLHHTAADRCSQPYGSLPVFSGFLGGLLSSSVHTRALQRAHMGCPSREAQVFVS